MNIVKPGITLRKVDSRRQEGLDSQSLVIQAKQAQSEQEFLTAVADIGSKHSAAFESVLEAKQTQANQIAAKIELMIESQSANLQRLQGAQPGMFALPSSRRKWQTAVTQCSARIQKMQLRLELVREIKDGMGLHGPRIDELASRKLRSESPDLAGAWDVIQAEIRKRQYADRSRSADEQARESSRAHSLRLKQSSAT